MAVNSTPKVIPNCIDKDSNSKNPIQKGSYYFVNGYFTVQNSIGAERCSKMAVPCLYEGFVNGKHVFVSCVGMKYTFSDSQCVGETFVSCCKEEYENGISKNVTSQEGVPFYV